MTDRTNYIDRQTAYDVLTEFYHHTTDVQHNALREALNKVPSADVQPVRHGYWLRTGRTNVYGGFEVECSVCNDNVMITNIEYEHYCRNCGALMDGEQHE